MSGSSCFIHLALMGANGKISAIRGVFQTERKHHLHRTDLHTAALRPRASTWTERPTWAARHGRCS
eukprot:2010961-Pyramimonas_sp.AAC.1